MPNLVCELAVLNMLGTLNPTVKTFPFGAWGVKTLGDLLILVQNRSSSLNALMCTVWYYFGSKFKCIPSYFCIVIVWRIYTLPLAFVTVTLLCVWWGHGTCRGEYKKLHSCAIRNITSVILPYFGSSHTWLVLFFILRSPLKVFNCVQI